MKSQNGKQTCDEQIGEALFLWSTQMRSKKALLQGPMILGNVHRIAT